MKISAILTALIAFIIIPATAWSFELSVYDQRGLLRSQTNVKEHGSVSVKLKAVGGYPEIIDLKNADGLAADVKLSHAGSGTYRSRQVPAGSWTISLPPEGFVVEQVEVQENS